jgi:lysophospholipase L1-like esterase
MPFAKDSLQDTAGVALTSHTPSGTGATGGAWTAGVSSGYVAPVATTGGFHQTNATGSSTSYLNVAAPGDIYAEVVVNFPNDTGYAGPALVLDAIGAGGHNYYFGRVPGAWQIGKDGTATVLATPTEPFFTGVSYTLRLERKIVSGNAQLIASINGTPVSIGAVADSSSPYVGALYPGIFGALPSGTYSSFIADYILSLDASNSGFIYYGRWKSGTTAITINNGSEVNFTYTGNACAVVFDVSSVTSSNFPTIAYWVDNVGPTRQLLDATGYFTITPAQNGDTSGRHTVRLQANIESGYPSSVDNWGSQTDAVKFNGLALASGGSLLSLVANPNTIEFLGDSITASLRVLYTGGGDTTAVNAPEIGWPEYVSQRLGLHPIVNGHGGQSLTQAGTDGTPAATTAFPYIYSGVSWSPTNPPIAVVIYQGTNGTAPTQAQYTALLSAIRSAYPFALIFAINPYNISQFSVISAAVAAGDSKMFALDYGSAFQSSDLVSDGLHFNESGVNAMAAKLSHDIATQFNTSGLKMQINSGGSGSGGGSAIVSRNGPFVT